MAEVCIHTITVAARDPASLARFWMATLGYRVTPNHTDSVQIGDPGGIGPTMLFAAASLEGFGRDRFHLDLRPDDQPRAIAEAIARGATALDTPAGAGWQRMADPEGNRFCLLQSRSDAAEFERLHGGGAVSM